MPLSDDMNDQISCSDTSGSDIQEQQHHHHQQRQLQQHLDDDQQQQHQVEKTPSSSSSSSSSLNSSSVRKFSAILSFPPAPIPVARSFINSLFSTPEQVNLGSAILSTTTLLTFPLSMDLADDQKPQERQSKPEVATDADSHLLPVCLISSPTPPLDKIPNFSATPWVTRVGASSLPKSESRSSSASAATSGAAATPATGGGGGGGGGEGVGRVSSSSTPSLTSLEATGAGTCSAPPYKYHASLSPPKDGFVSRKMQPGKKLSVAINPTMNRLKDGCHTAGVVGQQSRERHKRESILHKSDFIMKDMSPSIRSSLGSFNDCGQEDSIITPYAQLLNSLRNIRNNYFVVANLSPMRSRRPSGYEVQRSVSVLQMTEESKQKLALDTLEEIEFCLDKLENMQTHPSAGQLAAHKFRQILSREMSQNPDLKTGGPITGYLKTFLEESGAGEENSNSNSSNDNNKRELSVNLESIKILENGEEANAENSRKRIGGGGGGGGGGEKTEGEINLSLTRFIGNVSPQLDELIKSTSNTWGVDLFELSALSSNRPLTHVALHLFQERQLLRKLRVDPSTMLRYVSRIEDNYRPDNPYHNNIHATDVLQATHYMLAFSTFEDVFSDLEIFAALFSAAVHDVDHPGVTNQFLINTNSELAIMYNDESVLENHHATLAFKLLADEACDVTSSFTRHQRQTFRKMVISIILATDMSKHMQHVANLKTMAEVKRLSSSSSSSSVSNVTFDHDNHEDKIQILQSVVHCSDLSNPLKPLEIYLKWTDRIMEEFFNQGDREKHLGLDVSPLCDRNSSDICKSQIGFIDYVVYPLWETWGALTQPDSQIILDHLENNRVWLTTQNSIADSKNKRHEDHDDDDDDDDD